MNERNVERLRVILTEEARRVRHPLPPETVELLAFALAVRGVLVPAVLTDDEAVKLGADAVVAMPTDPGEIALCVREGLERIARATAGEGPVSKPPRSPSEIYDVLFRLQQVCFEAGSLEASYHVLAAALHAAEDAGKTEGIQAVIAIAEHRQGELDSARYAGVLTAIAPCLVDILGTGP